MPRFAKVIVDVSHTDECSVNYEGLKDKSADILYKEQTKN